MTLPAPLDDDARWLLSAFADGIRPDPIRTVSEWADAERMVTEGAQQGRWRTDRTPYLREVMDALSLSCPAQRVTFKASAQVGKSQCGLNLLGQVLGETPAPVLVVLPSLTSLQWYNRDKLEPMISASPGLARAVADITSRDGAGSTTRVKRGARGAQVELVTAASSKDLQSRTARVLVLEEISEYPRDVDGRGDPVEMALARTIQFRAMGIKVFDCSTPGTKGECRVTDLYETGSGAQYHVPCLHCGERQVLALAQLTWPRGAPDAAAYACRACGALHAERDKRAMLEGGGWEHARPELAERHPSYHISALYSPFTPWAEVAKEAEKVEADPSRGKVFAQQWLGEAWDAAFDLPKADVLLLRRDAWKPGRVPPGVLLLQGATDVQGDRLVWAVWGFDRHFGQWLIETGTIPGDPTLPATWQVHDALLARRWTDAWGRELAPEGWGVDAGYLSSHVYAYARRHASRAAPRVWALDGRAGWRLPSIGTPKQVTVDYAGARLGTVQLWPVGTWDIKSELAGALRLTEQGPGPEGWPPGALRYNEQIDRAWLQELLAERLVENPRTGARAWAKIAARNEAWDLAVYARALARHETMAFTEAAWDRLTAQRSGPPDAAQADLDALWAPRLKALAEEAARGKAAEVPAAAPVRRPAPEDRFFDGAERFWGD